MKFLNKNLKKKFSILLYVKPNLVFSHFQWWWWGMVQGEKIKVAQNGLKHIFVEEILKYDFWSL